jgi:hypothetical protein
MTKARIRIIRAYALKSKDDTAAAMLKEALDVIEELQRYTRRGEVPAAPVERPQLALDVKPNPRKCARGTLPELQAFAKDQGMPPSDGEFLFHHFEGKGWKDVKDWRAHFRKWKSAKWLPSQKGPNGERPQRSGPVSVNL